MRILSIVSFYIVIAFRTGEWCYLQPYSDNQLL